MGRMRVRRLLVAGFIGVLLTLGVAAPVGASYDHHREDGSICRHFDDNGECIYRCMGPG